MRTIDQIRQYKANHTLMEQARDLAHEEADLVKFCNLLQSFGPPSTETSQRQYREASDKIIQVRKELRALEEQMTAEERMEAVRLIQVPWRGFNPAPPIRDEMTREAIWARGEEMTRDQIREYKRAYNRGWRASQGWTEDPLGDADGRGEPDSWYEGYEDDAAHRQKWHSLHCRDHDSNGCGEA